jgi:phosphoserine aminotransferase
MSALGRYIFSAGPVMLPRPVRDRIRDDLVDWRGTGFSVLELSQWDDALLAMFDKVEADLRELLDVPDDYAVLFLHGGASNQFAMVPMNLLCGRRHVDYLHTGLWSGKAVHDARAPSMGEPRLDERAAYLHYTPVETVHGVQFDHVPDSGGTTLVADISSALFSVDLDVRRFGLVYASAQKNLGVVGMTLVIVHRDLIGHADPRTPTTFDYAVHERTRSRFTTPPIFPWYVAGLMLDWVREQGGAAVACAASRRNAELLYAAIDGSGLFTAPVEFGSRASASVPFHLTDTRLTGRFIAEAEAAGLHGLRGHPALGGLRACLYLGMPEAGVQALTGFLKEFEARHG